MPWPTCSPPTLIVALPMPLVTFICCTSTHLNLYDTCVGGLESECEVYKRQDITGYSLWQIKLYYSQSMARMPSMGYALPATMWPMYER